MECNLDDLLAASASVIQESAGDVDVTMLVTHNTERHTTLLTTLDRDEAYRVVEMTARRLEIEVMASKVGAEH